MTLGSSRDGLPVVLSSFQFRASCFMFTVICENLAAENSI